MRLRPMMAGCGGALVGLWGRRTTRTDHLWGDSAPRQPRPDRSISYNRTFELIRECLNYMSIARIVLLGLVDEVK